jgi:hypothetical protein
MEKRLPMPRSDKEAMTELKRIGNNLNQLTRAINQQYPVTERHIETVLELAAAAIRKIAR